MTRGHPDDCEQLIFVSYAHENKDWIAALGLDQIPATTESASFWLDENQLHAGDDWPKTAKEALERATAAVLLISREFLDSTSIREHELPTIMTRYREGQIRVVFVPIGRPKINEIERKLGLEIRDIISIPSWDKPLPRRAKRCQGIREEIVSGATEPRDVQNLRRHIASQYALEEKLGDGAFSTVFKAHDYQLERKVLVKLLRTRKHAEYFKTVRKVARATAQANILSLYGACLDADPPHYFVEYVSGRHFKMLWMITGEGNRCRLIMPTNSSKRLETQ